MPVARVDVSLAHLFCSTRYIRSLECSSKGSSEVFLLFRSIDPFQVVGFKQ